MGRLPLIRSRGYYYRYPKTDLGRIFEGKYAGKHLCERRFPNQGAYLGPETAQRPFRCAPTLKAFPLGGRWAGKAGSDEGAILYPTFPCRKEKAATCRPNGIFLLPRWATRSPPHPSPSVTASPQGEASGLCSPTRKSVPNQGTYMGPETAPRPPRCAPPRQNERVGTSGL